MDRLFLDANVLFSAAYRESSGLMELWRLPKIQLLSSSYAMEEARRNLSEPAQRARLALLSEPIQIVDLLSESRFDVLPEKDQPILRAAVAAQATHLITGDVKHFGKLFGSQIGGVLVLTASAYLKTRP